MVNMGTKFFSLKKGEKSKPDNSFSTLPSKKSARKQLDPALFNDPSINQEYFLDQHGSVSVIGFRNPDKELASKSPMTNFLPAVGTYSSKVTPRIDPIPLKSSSSQNLVGAYNNNSRNSPLYASKSSINIQAPRDSYYRESTRRSMKGSPYSSPYRNRSIISTGGSSITNYFSYENLNSSTEKNISSSTKPNMSLNFGNGDLDGSQIFDSFYNTQAIQDAERALTRNSKYPNGRPTSQRSINSDNSQFKYRTTINLENLEDIMRLSRESIKKSSMQKALNGDNMASSQDDSQLTLASTRRRSNPKTIKTIDPNSLEAHRRLQELPEEQSDSDSFYDPLPILSRPGSDLDQSNSLTSPSERNEDTSASSSHDLYEGSNNVNLDLRTPKFVSINADNTIDFNSIREGDTTLNSSGVLELGPNISLNDSSILGSSQNNQHYVYNNSPNFSDKNPSQPINFTTEPPMPPPKPKSFLTNSSSYPKSNSASRNVSLLNIQTTSETGGPLIAPPRPKTHADSSENLKEKQDLLPQSPDQVPEKPSFYVASNPSGKFKSSKAHSASYSQDSNTGSFPENDFSLGISNSIADESGLSLPSFLNDIIENDSSHDEGAINQDLELDNSEIYDPFSLKKQIFEESELPEQVAKAESICNPSSVINHKIESESASVNCSESIDLDSPVFEESDLLPKSPKLESITDGPAEAANELETSPVDSRDIFSHSRIALDESDLIPESFKASNNAKIDPITNSPLTIDAAKSESSSPNLNSLTESNALISNFPKPVDEMDKSKQAVRESNLSEEVEFRIEKSDETHLNDSNIDSKIDKFMNFPLPDPLAKGSYPQIPTIGIRIEESSLRQSRELANSRLDADNSSQKSKNSEKSKNSGRRYKFPEPIIPPPMNFGSLNSGNSLLSPISKTRFHEDDNESGSDTTPQRNSFGITGKYNMASRLHPSRSAGLAFSSGNSSTSITSHIPPKTPKSATFGNHVEYDESILSIDDQDMYEKVRKLEEECFKYRDEIDSQAYLINETTKLMIEERENKVRAEYELKMVNNQLEEANKSLEEANNSLEQANKSLEEQSMRIKSLEEANSSLELVNKSLEEANSSLEEKSKRMDAAELELEEAKSELLELRKINEELSIQLESNSELKSALDEARSTIFQLEQDTKNNESVLIEKDDKLSQLEKDHIQLKSNFNSISQDLEDLRRINQQEWLNSSRNSSFMSKPRTRTGSSSSSEGKSKYGYSSRKSDTLSSSGDISRSTIFEESGDEVNERSFQFTRDSTDTIIAARRMLSLSNNNSEIDINPPNDSNNYYEEYQKCNERVKKLLKQIEGRDKQIAQLNELIKSQSSARSSALNNYNKLASRSMSQLNTPRSSNSSINSGKSNRSNIFESATLTIQKLQSQLNGIDNGDTLSPRKLNSNISFNEPSVMSPTLFSPTFKQFTSTEAERSFTNDSLNHLPVSFKLNDIKYREFIEFTGSELKERADTDFVKRVMAEDIEYLISCDPNLNNWRTHKQILQALQNSELTLIDSKVNNSNDHFTISDLVQQSKSHDRSLSSGKIKNTCELCGNHPHHTVTPQYYYKIQLQSDPNPICSACFHRLGTAQKFFKFLSQGINRSNAGFQPHKLYFEVLQLKLDMFLARNGINTPNEIENELIRSHLLWRTNDL